MKKVLKVFSILFLVCFSFYYTEKIAVIMKNKDVLMVEIKNKRDNYNIDYVNAVIEGDTIIPGVNGLSINNNKSYNNMKSINVFNEYYLEYDQVKPEISLLDNKDKIIIKGNKNKKAIALIIENNEKAKAYLKNLGYDINYEDICVTDIENECNSNDLKVKSSLTINHQNILTIKNDIESGDIILIEQNVSIEEIKTIIDEIKYRDLKIVSLNDLISEENNIN